MLTVQLVVMIDVTVAKFVLVKVVVVLVIAVTVVVAVDVDTSVDVDVEVKKLANNGIAFEKKSVTCKYLKYSSSLYL